MRADPSLLPGAVEEILRYANPLHYFRRTATADTELHGVDIPAGDKVLMYYTSANRDETVFDDPHSLRHPPVARTRTCRSASASTSASARTWPGSRAGCSSRSCSTTFSAIELTGDPVRVRSNLNAGYKRMPMRLTTA